MEACFPVVMAALREMKRDDYRRAAHLAQRTESEFIIGRCVGRLRRENPDLFITTIHDSIVTTAGAERIVRGIMREEFARGEQSLRLDLADRLQGRNRCPFGAR